MTPDPATARQSFAMCGNRPRNTILFH